MFPTVSAPQSLFYLIKVCENNTHCKKLLIPATAPMQYGRNAILDSDVLTSEHLFLLSSELKLYRGITQENLLHNLTRLLKLTIFGVYYIS